MGYYADSYAEIVRRNQARELREARRALASERNEELIPGTLFEMLLVAVAIGAGLGAIWAPLALLAVPHGLVYGLAFFMHLIMLLTRPLRLAKLHWTIYRLSRTVREEDTQ
jgi:hypothetical protein